MILRLSPEVQRDLILSVGTHRGDRRLSPIEVAEAMEAAINAGTSVQQLASVLLLEDSTMITRFRRLLRLTSAIKHLVGWGGKSGLSIETAEAVARLQSQEEQEFVAKAVLEHRLSKQEVKQIVQIRERSGKPIVECTEDALRMRPQIEKRHILIGAIISPNVREVLIQMKQQERDQFLKNALILHAPELPPWEGHLGIDRFTLVGSEDFSATVLGLPGGFEEAVNLYLETEVSEQNAATD